MASSPFHGHTPGLTYLSQACKPFQFLGWNKDNMEGKQKSHPVKSCLSCWPSLFIVADSQGSTNQVVCFTMCELQRASENAQKFIALWITRNFRQRSFKRNGLQEVFTIRYVYRGSPNLAVLSNYLVRFFKIHILRPSHGPLLNQNLYPEDLWIWIFHCPRRFWWTAKVENHELNWQEFKVQIEVGPDQWFLNPAFPWNSLGAAAWWWWGQWAGGVGRGWWWEGK